MDDIAHEQTIISRQIFAGHVVGLSVNEMEEKFALNAYSLNLLPKKFILQRRKFVPR